MYVIGVQFFTNLDRVAHTVGNLFHMRMGT